MLRDTQILDKTFDERIDEGISKIPVYSREWTNYNASDPGITILDNLSLFETLQQEHINELPPEVIKALLKMTGFESIKGRCARVLLSSKGLDERSTIPKGARFHVGDVVFESPRRQEIIDDGLIGVCSKIDDVFYDFSDILDTEIKLPAHVFGHKPKTETAIYFIFKYLPLPGEELVCHVDCLEESMRNAFSDKDKDIFSTLTWEILCEDGFEEINYKDHTGGFVTSGELYFRMPQSEAVIFTDANRELPTIPEGYCIRATVKKAEYDVAPAIIGMSSGLFEVVQMDSRSYLISDNKASGCEISESILNSRYVSVFAREEKGGSFKKYEEASEDSGQGRFYRISHKENGRALIVFDKRKYGFGPEKSRGSIKIVAYAEDIVGQYRIGTVIGYDHETFDLPLNNIVVDNFSIIAKRTDENGEEIYDFVRPGHNKENELCYYLNEREGKIQIEYAGDFIGAELFVGGLCQYLGEKGNIRSGVILKSDDVLSNIIFKNAVRGHGGRYTESLRSLRLRYKADIEKPFAAVTAADYESIVKTTPGLCISKVKATMDRARNQVNITVLPSAFENDRYPRISADYRKRISERLEERRLLTDRISIEDPRYIKVNVKAVVYVSNNTPGNQEILEQCINDCLDYVRNDASFGETLKYDYVFNKIEELPFVDYVFSLILRPSSMQFVTMDDIDIKPHYSGLFVPGNINIEMMINHK